MHLQRVAYAVKDSGWPKDFSVGAGVATKPY